MAYFDKYGVEFSDDKKTLVKCPKDFEGEYIIPNSVTSIGRSAFWGCSSLTSVTIPDSVTSIGRGAFYLCKGLNSVVWNAKNYPDCNSKNTPLYSVYYGESGDEVELDMRPQITSFTFGTELEHIPAYLCYGMSNLTSIEIPNSVTSIGDYAFRGCTGLTSVTIPNSVKSIGYMAFLDCRGLTSITIPNSVTSIGDVPFYRCSCLKEIIVPRGQKARFEQMGGLKDLKDKIVERDNEELTVLFNIGKAYELGIGVTQSSAQAILYYVQAAEKGCTEAAFHLGEWYRDGKNVPQDEPKALDYFQQAAKSGFAKAAEQVNALKQSIAERKEEEERRLREKEEAKKRQEEKERLKWLELEQERQRQKAEQEEPYYLFFDTETTGVPQNYKAPITKSSNWPRLVQLAWLMADKNGNVLKKKSVIIKPSGFTIPSDAAAVHGITTERAQREGQPLDTVMEEFMNDVQLAASVVGHNIDFDMHIVGAELYRLDMDYDLLMDKPCTCTMKSSTDFCAIPNPNTYFGGYKWPSLQELYRKLFDRSFEDAHDALADISATKDCYFELKRRGII